MVKLIELDESEDIVSLAVPERMLPMLAGMIAVGGGVIVKAEPDDELGAQWRVGAALVMIELVLRRQRFVSVGSGIMFVLSTVCMLVNSYLGAMFIAGFGVGMMCWTGRMLANDLSLWQRQSSLQRQMQAVVKSE